MLRNLGPLTGRLSRAELEACAGWQAAWSETYDADPAALAAIRAHAAGAEVLIFNATWCPDCRREVPRFFKIVDQAGVGELPLSLFGLDRTLRDAEGLAAHWGIKAVPTFVFVKDGRELGRVIERPGRTLEGDIAHILSGASE